jgi:hypothetical protein
MSGNATIQFALSVFAQKTPKSRQIGRTGFEQHHAPAGVILKFVRRRHTEAKS